METASLLPALQVVRKPEVGPSIPSAYIGGKGCAIWIPLTILKMCKSDSYFVLQDFYWFYSAKENDL